MGVEIERKFLLAGNGWKQGIQGNLLRQGYIVQGSGTTVRIRTCRESGFLTIKGQSLGLSRPEFEYRIPLEDANFLLEHLCVQPIIEKFRYIHHFHGFDWEIDEFLGENTGLFLAEIELTAEDQNFPRPPWLGQEVTGDPRYFNSSLVKNPYKNWKDDK